MDQGSVRTGPWTRGEGNTSPTSRLQNRLTIQVASGWEPQNLWCLGRWKGETFVTSSTVRVLPKESQPGLALHLYGS